MANAKRKRGRPARDMKRTSVFLGNEQLEHLATLSRRKGISVADLIRDGVKRLLAAHGVKTKREGR